MPLTACPDCGNEISVEAYVCTKCGRPTAKHVREQAKMQKQLRYWLIASVVLLGGYESWLAWKK